MKHLRVILLALLLAFLATPLVALASNITNARYWAQILVSNNSTATTNVAVPINYSLNTTNLINGNDLNATATNSVMRTSSGADIPFMPGYTPGGYPWCVWVPSIGANSYLTDILYTANSTGGEMRYFPASGGMTTSDSASLELGDNFTYEAKGWMDTTVGGDIVRKPGVFRLVTDAAGNVTATLPTFYDGFTADAWTDVGTKIHVTVGNTRLDYESERSAIDERGFYDYTSISDSTWTMEWQMTRTSAAAGCLFYFGLFDNTANVNGYATDYISVMSTVGTLRIRRSDGGVTADSATITVPSAFTYYLRLERVSPSLVELSVFTNAGMTTHLAGSPVSLVIPNTVVTLRYIQASNFDDNAGAAQEVIGYIKDVVIAPVAVSASGVSSGEHAVRVAAHSGNYTQFVDIGDTLHFDGTATSNVNAGVIHNNAAKMWVSLRFKPDNLIDDTNAAPIRLWGKYLNATEWLGLYFTSGAHAGELLLRRQLGGGVQFQAWSVENEWLAGEWYHVLFSISNTGAVRLIVDGGTAVTDADVSAAPNGGDFVMGDQDDPGAGDAFIGVVADVFAGTDDLTPAEEVRLYQGIPPADAVNIWPLNEGTGTTAIDLGTGGNNGTIDTAPTWTTGTRYNDFYINVDGDPKAPLTDNFGADLWTDVGAGVGVNVGNSRMEWNTTNNVEHSYRALPSTLSNTKWSMDYTYRATTAGVIAISGFGIIDSVNGDWGTPGVRDAIFVVINNLNIRARAWDGGSASVTNTIAILLNTTYYITLERTSATNMTLSIFTDAARTLHQAGSPQSATISASIVGLDMLQVAGYAGGAQSVGWLDSLYLEDNLETSAGKDLYGASVPDNANDWVSFTDNCTLYAEYQKIWVGEVQQQDVEWEYSTTFTDLSGNSHPATPTFRTLSSDPDVSANMTSFLPISEAQAPGYVLGAAPPFIDAAGLVGNITAPFTVVPPTTGFPLAGVIAAVAAATSTPAQLPLLIIALIVILATSLTISALIRQKGSGSIIIKIIAITAVMGIFIALQNFGIDFWMLGVFLVISIALAFASKQLGWT